MASNSTLALAVTTGIAALVGGVAAWKLRKEWRDIEEDTVKDLTDILPLIRIEDVGKLLNSSSSKVRKSAEQFLIHKASRSENLIYILQQTLSDDLDQVVKAVTVIRMIAKASELNKAKLLDARALMILPQCIGKISDDFKYKVLVENIKSDVRVEKIVTRCIGAIFQLVLHDSVNIINFSKESALIRNIMLNIISDEGYHILTDMKRWSTYIVNQLSQCSMHPIKKHLRKWGIIRKTSQCLMSTLGDLLQTQLCLQIIVHYLNDPIEEIIKVCEEMALLGVLPHLIGLLRCDEDENIVQLSAVIIHHFCCFDIEIKFLSSVPGIVKILYAVLNSHDSTIQKTIIRIANYLSVGSAKFQKMLVDHKPMIKKLSICLASGNPDVVQGSLMLIHDIVMPGKWFAQNLVLVNPEILKALVSLSLSSSGETVQLIAETLGFICSCESLHNLILKCGVVNAILHFAKSSDVAVQFWASALLLNLTMISDVAKEIIVRNGGVHTLLEMAVSGDEVEFPDIAVNATKSLVILGFSEAVIKVELVSGLEGSIKIDGTEYCPGKQGVNLVSLDFINYKYSRGKVIQPEELEEFVNNHMTSWKKSDPVFVVTQGDCSVLQEGEEIPEDLQQFTDNDNKYFLYSPAWCLILSPLNTKVKYGDDNLEFNIDIPLGEFINVVLKDNFSDPLIDVLLSMPPGSNINKTSELELIEILARHQFQRKAIVNTNGFVSFLHELIWVVASAKNCRFQDSKPPVKIAHCLSALKILHSCSIDNDTGCLNDLVNQGMIEVLTALIMSLVPQLSGSQSEHVDNEQKAAWYDLIEPLEEKEEGLPNEEADDEINDTIFNDVTLSDVHQQEMGGTNLFSAIYHREIEETTLLSDNDSDASVNEELFQLVDMESQSGTPQPTRRRTVRYADEVDQEATSTVTDRSENSRMRADSFIVRSDSRTLHREDSRTHSILEGVTSIDDVRFDRSLSVLDNRPTSRSTSVSVEHRQLRRISRSMSISMQQTKQSHKEDALELPTFSCVVMEILRNAVIILHRAVNVEDKEIVDKVTSTNILSILASLPGFVNPSSKQRIGAAVSYILATVSKSLVDSDKETSPTLQDIYLNHATSTKSAILSSDQLTVVNENWYFESVIANQGIGKSMYEKNEEPPLGWYFEVEFYSDGIIQIGLAVEGCEFNAKKGVGVGDNAESVGFDGARCKMWSGPSVDVALDNDYGIEWQAGDTVGVLLSWGGVLSYRLNGKDLGPALSSIDTSKTWFPALSLSTNQSCKFVFKRKHFKYICPTGYDTVSELKQRVDSKTAEITMDMVESIKHEQAIPTDLVDTTMKQDFTGKSLYLYYEFDVTHCKSDSYISFGYVYSTSTVDTKDGDTPSTVDTKDDDAPFKSHVNYITKSIKKTDDFKMVGCGISLPDLDVIITINGKVVYEERVDSILVDSDNLRLIPYVSIERIKFNFGEGDFVFQIANSNTVKYQSFEFISQLIENSE